jgi:hypothetical protein
MQKVSKPFENIYNVDMDMDGYLGCCDIVRQRAEAVV